MLKSLGYHVTPELSLEIYRFDFYLANFWQLELSNVSVEKVEQRLTDLEKLHPKD